MTIACPDCGTVQELPRLAIGQKAVCRTCEAPLQRTVGRSLDAALACSAATLIVLFPANLAPLLSVHMLGAERRSHVWSGVVSMWRGGFVIPAALIAAFVIVLPFARFGLLTVTLGALRLGRRPAWLGRAFRWAMWLDPWAMPDVFLIGCFVGYSRVRQELPVSIRPGGWCVIAAALLCMLTRAALDRRRIWKAIQEDARAEPGARLISCTSCDLVAPAAAEGGGCARCGLTLRARKTDALVRPAALITAGFILYWPANIYPMNRAVQPGTTTTHRIIDGIRELIQAGLWPLAALIFCTSIAIPVLKLAAIAWMLVSTHRRSRARLLTRTKLYRFIEEIGRWSNVDVFTLAVFVPLIQFGSFASTATAPGAVAFILVVVLTMAAARSFDPRLMWDAAERA